MNAHSADWPGVARSTRLSVPGMHCAACIGRIERELPRRPGISGARANFSNRTVRVTHDGALTEPDLVAALAAIGYDAQPISDTAASERSLRLSALLRALAVAAFAAMNVMLLSVSIWSGAEGPTRQMFHALSALIAVPAIGYAGRPFFASAWNALKVRTTNMDVPISIGVLLATGMSVYETATGGPHAYFDGALMLLAFLLAGRALDEMMRGRAASGAEALVRQLATGAWVVVPDGTNQWIAAADIRLGDQMRVAAGERLAADGDIVHGASRFDLSLLTGESAPVALAEGGALVAGALNLDAPVIVRATAVGEERAIAEMARLMEAATQSRSRYVRLADRAARLYAPAVHSLAALSFAGWMIAGAGWHQSLMIATAVLIITCPCALGLAVPVAQVVACGALMRRGILVKDGSALERLASADEAWFDKTGTLTLGRPEPQGVDDLSDGERRIALGLAMASRHPLASALGRKLGGTDVAAAPLEDVREVAGDGVYATAGHIAVAMRRPRADELADDGADDRMAVALDLGGPAVRIVRFSDLLRPDANEAVGDLEQLGLPATVISGDRTAVVDAVARTLGIAASGDLRPQEKLARLGERIGAGRHPLMVGDGLNDGPALAAAHVSMAPASASDVGQQAADILFLGDSLSSVPRAVRAARRTMAVVRGNLGMAVLYNVAAVPLAMLGHVTPLIAALAMSLSSVIVIGNSLRLRGAAT